MTFKPYPKYKASGVEWLGDVPEGWSVAPLKRTVAMINEKIQAKDTAAGYVGMENIESWSGKFVESASDFEAEGLSNGFDVGDVLFGKLRPYLAKAWLSDRTGVCSSELLVLRPKNVVAKYLLHQVLNRDFVTLVDSSTYGSKMPRASWDYIGGIELPLPPICDQVTIASFLDRETTKIDSLIASQEAMINLLKEKRQAVISHAVTKGLDPNVPMKASGVKWLGDVPEHWIVRRLKHLVYEGIAGPYGSSLTKSMYSSSGYRVYGQQQVIPDDFNVGDYYISPDKFAEMARYAVRPNDILISVMGTIGRAALVPIDVEPGIINPRLVLYRAIDEEIYPRYLQLFINNPTSQRYFSLVAQGTTMEGLNMVSIGELQVPLPPREEQAEIITYLDKAVGKIDTLIAKAQQAITLQREHRTALISAAVTGKIDVRNEISERKAA